MSKCCRLFGKKHSEFIRVFLFGNKSKLEHFKSGLLINRLIFNSKGELISKTDQNSENLLDLLIGLKLPVELVLFHRSMACKLFSTKVSGIGNVNSVVKHALNDSHCNTVFYCRLSSNKNIGLDKKLTYGLCTCDVSDNFTKLLLNNTYGLNITSTSVFPIWVTTAFFISRCKHNILTPALFVIDYMDYLHIILTENGYVVYNRSVSLENKNKDDEVHNTLNHIKNVIDINMNSLVIYEFGDNVVDYLSSCSEIKMKIISTEFNNTNPNKRVQNSIFKIACIGFAGVLFSDTMVSAYKINKINNKTDDLNVRISNSKIASDINAWNELCSKNLLNQPNYEKAIKEYTCHRTEKLQNITMYCEEGDNVSVTEDANNSDDINNKLINANDAYDVSDDDYISEQDNAVANDDDVDDDDISNDENLDEDYFPEDYTDGYYVNESVTVNA